MLRGKTAWALSLGATVAALAGCGDGPVQTAAAPPRPTRIVSLAPSVTETLFALALGDRVVGVTRYCDYPETAATKAQVGGFLDPSYEAIVALQPDLVIVQQDSGESESRVQQLGIATLRVDQHDVAGILSSVETIARACGVPERGRELAGELRRRLERVREQTRGTPRPRTLVVVGREPGVPIRSVWVAGQTVFYSEVLQLAGGVNAYTGSGGAFPEVSREGLFALDPDVIVDVLPEAARRGLDELRVRADWDELGQLKAVRSRRVVVLKQAFMERPGPRIVAMVDAVARALHPEVAWPGA